LELEPDIYFFVLDFGLLLLANPMGFFLGLFLVVLLLVCSALISGSEIAFFSINANEAQTLEKEGKLPAERILQLRSRPTRLLATILICNNFINIAIVVLSDNLLREAIPNETTMSWASNLIAQIPLLESLISPFVLGKVFHYSITVVGVTFLLVLFGEVAPKVYARFNNIALAKLMSRPLSFLSTAFSPLSSMLIGGTSFIEKRFQKISENGTHASKEDVEQAIKLTVQTDHNADQEFDILKSIVKFGDISAKQIMCSRVDVVAVDFRMTFHELLKLVKDCGYSRLPVYEDDMDTITGILYVKDLIPHLEDPDEYEWQELVRPNVLYAPESKRINDLLKEFQSERLHMAVVVDEYGGTSGVVTLEDIMEEVIGEIRDETDEEDEVDYEKIDEFNYLFEGKTLLNDVCRIVGMDIETFESIQGDADTIAGLSLEMMGQLPRKNSEISFGGYKIKIVSVTKRRIEKLKLTLPVDYKK